MSKRKHKIAQSAETPPAEQAPAEQEPADPAAVEPPEALAAPEAAPEEAAAATALLEAAAARSTQQDDAELERAIESLLFITDHPLGLSRLCALLEVKEPERVSALVMRIRETYEARGGGLQLMEIAEGFQLATRQDAAPFVRKLFSERMTMRLSTAALETLAIIAYKQPLTRAEVEDIRGVEVIAALETLLEKRLLKVVGRKETVGRPLLYGTTPDFLRQFGLRSLADLPPIDSLPSAEPAGPQGPLPPFASAEAPVGRSEPEFPTDGPASLEQAARDAIGSPAAEPEAAPEAAAGAQESSGGIEGVARRALEEEPGQD